MPSLDIIDHSPHHPDPSPPIPTASNLILIDNYDSFTWNVYQYLVLEGANVTVFRNDKITLPELIDKKPTQLIISPGPGHPETDSGVSRDAIKHFAGKVLNGISTNARVGLGMSRSRADDQLGWLLVNQLRERNLVISEDGDVCAFENQVLVDVPGERVVIVDENQVGCRRNRWRRVRVVG